MKKLLVGLAVTLACVVIAILIITTGRTGPTDGNGGSSKVNSTAVQRGGPDAPPAGPQSEALEALIAGLDDHDRSQQMSSALLLAKSNNARALQAILTACPNRDITFRWQVAEALAQTRSVDLSKHLIAALDNEHWQVREFALLALADMNEAIGIYPLLSTLKNRDPYLRKLACWKLGCIRDTQAIEPLFVDIILKYDEYENIIWGAISISMITEGQVYFGGDLEKWEQWWQQNKHKYARMSG